jgi:hypothetical protein
MVCLDQQPSYWVSDSKLTSEYALQTYANQELTHFSSLKISGYRVPNMVPALIRMQIKYGASARPQQTKSPASIQ